MRRRVPWVIVAGIAVLGARAGAATCLVSATPVSFGIYNSSSSQDSLGAGVVSVTCSVLTGNATAAFSIAMTAGTGTYTARSLVSGTNKLTYNIYTDAGLSSVWGDGTGGSTMVSDSLQANVLGVTRTYTAYGRLPAQQATAAAGLYADTVIVTIAY